jgi:hypothetical protein
MSARPAPRGRLRPFGETERGAEAPRS